MARTKTDRRPLWLRLVWAMFVFTIVFGVLAAAGIATHYANWSVRPLLQDQRSVTFVIPHGTSWSGVVKILGGTGVVDRPRYFDVWGRRAELPARVKAGSYTVEGPTTLEELAEVLAKGGLRSEVSVTIPEGFNLWAIGARLEDSGLVSAQQFLEAAREQEALQAAAIEADSFEGYLFPDTYRFAAGTSAEALVQRMHQRWKDVWDECGADREEHGLNRHELVTLASIVEKESGASTERPLIARVFYNRIEREMPLQSDPTCVYSESRWQEVPTPKDCKDPLNQYSTYVIDGLPPGPIANPGREALEAVIGPAEAEGNDYLYFVAKRDGSGAHHFSRTFAEHNRAIHKYLR